MKIAARSRIHPKRLFLLLLLIVVAMLGFVQTARSQAQLSLADILIALRSKKVTLAERNKILGDAVKSRGITFSLTPEIEKELTTTGADKDLVEAIRQKGVIVKTSAVVPPPQPPPPDFAFYQKSGSAHIARAEWDLAIADYSKAIELKSAEPSVYLNRGLAHHNKKAFDLAVADYDRVIELSPNESIAWSNRADSNERMGNTQKALSDYKKAVELNANNEPAKAGVKRIEDELVKAAAAAAAAAKPVLPEPKPTPVVTTAVAAAPEIKILNLGNLTSNLTVRLVKPIYSPIAHKMNIQGKVQVDVEFDEQGSVISAKAIDGPQLLRSAAEDAAKKSKFKPAVHNGQPIKARGFVVYNFTKGS